MKMIKLVTSTLVKPQENINLKSNKKRILRTVMFIIKSTQIKTPNLQVFLFCSVCRNFIIKHKKDVEIKISQDLLVFFTLYRELQIETMGKIQITKQSTHFTCI